MHTPDQLYDVLVEESNKILDAGFAELESRYSESFLRQVLCRMDESENRLTKLLEKVGHMVAANQVAIARLTADIGTLQGKFDGLSTKTQNVSDAVDAESITLASIADQLRNTAGSGDADTINALADKIEGISGNLDTHTDKLDAIAKEAKDASAAATAQPITIGLSPKTATVAPGATQQFSVGSPSNFKLADGSTGSIDTSGLYTAPTDGSTSDTVTATSQTDPSVSESASVTISPLPPA